MYLLLQSDGYSSNNLNMTRWSVKLVACLGCFRCCISLDIWRTGGTPIIGVPYILQSLTILYADNCNSLLASNSCMRCIPNQGHTYMLAHDPSLSLPYFMITNTPIFWLLSTWPIKENNIWLAYRTCGHDLELSVNRFQHCMEHVQIAVSNELDPLLVTIWQYLLRNLQCNTGVPMSGEAIMSIHLPQLCQQHTSTIALGLYNTCRWANHFKGCGLTISNTGLYSIVHVGQRTWSHYLPSILPLLFSLYAPAQPERQIVTHTV